MKNKSQTPNFSFFLFSSSTNFSSIIQLNVSLYSVVGIATGYGLDCPGIECRSRWPRGLRRRSVAARLLRLRVRIPPRGMDVSVVCCK